MWVIYRTAFQTLSVPCCLPYRTCLCSVPFSYQCPVEHYLMRPLHTLCTVLILALLDAIHSIATKNDNILLHYKGWVVDFADMIMGIMCGWQKFDALDVTSRVTPYVGLDFLLSNHVFYLIKMWIQPQTMLLLFSKLIAITPVLQNKLKLGISNGQGIFKMCYFAA